MSVTQPRASVTLTTPSGRKFRTATKRRYVLVHETEGGAIVIVRRSDSLYRLQRERGGRATWDRSYHIIPVRPEVQR